MTRLVLLLAAAALGASAGYGLGQRRADEESAALAALADQCREAGQGAAQAAVYGARQAILPPAEGMADALVELARAVQRLDESCVCLPAGTTLGEAPVPAVARR